MPFLQKLAATAVLSVLIAEDVEAYEAVVLAEIREQAVVESTHVRSLGQLEAIVASGGRYHIAVLDRYLNQKDDCAERVSKPSAGTTQRNLLSMAPRSIKDCR